MLLRTLYPNSNSQPPTVAFFGTTSNYPSKAPNSEYTDSGDVSTESEPWGGVAEETEGMSPGGSKLSTHRSHTHWAKYVHIGGQGGANDGHMGGTSGANFPHIGRTRTGQSMYT